MNKLLIVVNLNKLKILVDSSDELFIFCLKKKIKFN